LYVFYKENAASQGSVVFTGGSTYRVAIGCEYSGFTTGVLDVTATNSGISTAPDSGTTTATTQAGELWFGALASQGVDAQSNPSNGFSLLEQNSGGTSGMAAYAKTVSATGTANVGATLPNSVQWYGAIVTFKQAASSSSTSTGHYLVAQDDTTGHKIYSITGSNVAGGTWNLIETITNSFSTRAVAFASGLLGVIYTSPYWSSPRRWNGTTAAAVSAAPPGRCICFHKNRFFIGGTAVQPSRLHYCALSDYTDWTTVNDAGSFDIAEDDGDAIEDIVSIQNGILIAKENSLHFLSGSGPDDFNRSQMDSGGGAPGRCICPTPYGAILAGLDHVWLWQGGSPELISKPIEDTYGITGDFVSTAYIDGIVYICDEGNGNIFAFNLVTGTWHVEKFSNANEGPAHVFAHRDKLFFGPQAATTYSLLNYRPFPTTRARDASVAQTFRAYTPEIWPGGPGQVVTPFFLHMKIRQHGGTSSDAGITVTPIYDGTTIDAKTVSPQNGAPLTFRAVVPIGDDKHGKGISRAVLQLAQTVTSSQSSIMDIEEMLLEYDIEELVR
jgi:hypothetical protein